jgi:hypothetical protein
MRQGFVVGVTSVGVVILSACGGSGGVMPAPHAVSVAPVEPASASAAPTPTPPPPADTSALAAETTASASEPEHLRDTYPLPIAGDAGLPDDAPIGPDAGAWAAAAVVPSAGAEPLGCRMRRLEGWAQLECGGSGVYGPRPPMGVIVANTTKRNGEVRAHRDAKHLVVTFRWNAGTDFTATFAWLTPDDAFDHVVFKARWPKAAKEPRPLGAFRGVPDVSAAKLGAFLCSCVPSFFGRPAQASCGLGNLGEGIGVNLPCARTHLPRNDCQNYRECVTLEPSASVTCEADEQLNAMCPACRCSIQCGPGKAACPPGFECGPGRDGIEGKDECSVP